MYDYTDYENFYEPSEYDMMVENFKDTLRKSVAKEWVDRMNELEKENNELQEIKKNFEEIKKDYEHKKQQCDWEKEKAIKDAEQNAKRMRLKELMQDVQKSYWKPSLRYVYTKKCNKCNENREIVFKSPSGKEMSENCECLKSVRVYFPICEVIYEISLKDGYNKTANIFFTEQRKTNDDNYYVSTEYYESKTIIEDDVDFATLNIDTNEILYFVSEEKCQEYCSWYNKEILKIDMSKYQLTK